MAGILPVAAPSAAARKPPAARRLLLAGLGGGAGVLGLTAIGLWLALAPAAPKPAPEGETARAVLDRMVVTVAESGEIDAKHSVNVACEVEGLSSIVWVIEEGTHVKRGDKLMELDSADLKEKVASQDMLYKTARALYEKSEKAFLIAQSTRESALATAGLTAKFGLMDLKKYLGNDLAERYIASEGKMPYDGLLKDKDLGGAALQQKRKLQSDIDLAAEELSRTTDKVEWTRKLKEKGYVTGNELQADELALKRARVALDQARTALDLFLVYEFPKAVEKAYTDWIEAKRELARVDTRTNSEVQSTRATRDNNKEALELEEARLKKVQDQLAKTTILAPAPGMVVYDLGGGRWGQQVIIEPGATVRHQQNIFKLPDMSEMNVKVKLHESVVKQTSVDAQAYVTIDALPKARLTGKVTKIAVMPDRGQMWLNPGLKNYVTEVTLDSAPQGLKPGMSGQVEILVDTRDAVLQVPVSAVYVEKGFQVVYARQGAGVETRRVEVGLSNQRTVEITKGLQPGEEVYLYKPPGAPELEVSEEELKKAQGEIEWKKPEVIRPAVPAAEESQPEPPRKERDKAATETRPGPKPIDPGDLKPSAPAAPGAAERGRKP
jgi:RND family efflux transporter MFP subunit